MIRRPRMQRVPGQSVHTQAYAQALEKSNGRDETQLKITKNQRKYKVDTRNFSKTPEKLFQFDRQELQRSLALSLKRKKEKSIKVRKKA